MPYLRTTPKPKQRRAAPAGFKQCRGCGEDVPVGLFWPSKQSRDGLDSWCRDCRVRVPQFPYEAPPPRTSEELLLEANASAEDRRLVIRLVEVHMRNEEGEKSRLRQKNPARRHKYSNEEIQFSECERILMQAGIGWRRQVRLMSASVALARESGVAFRYSRTGTLARSLECEESA